MSIAYIDGDTLYGSTVLFIIGGTRKEQIQNIADKMIENNFLGDWGHDEFYQKHDPDNKVNWEDPIEEKAFLIRILSNNLTIFNTDLTKAHEIYFYISVVNSSDDWYKHFEYISGGREGIKIKTLNLNTGETGDCDGVGTCR